MRRGFTMIELIFVIVILGILAAVAIPKLMATRTDAKIAKHAQNLGAAVNEITSYVTAQGKAESNLSKMSSIIAQYESEGLAKISNNEADVLGNCVKYKITEDANTNEINLTIDESDTNNTAICQGVRSAVKAKTYQLGGSRVKF